MLDLFRIPYLRKRALILSYVWLVLSSDIQMDSTQNLLKARDSSNGRSLGLHAHLYLLSPPFFAGL